MIRIFDIVFSFLGILICLPLFIIIYLLIAVESKGGGFYIQKRVGRNNIDFSLYKFRSMRVGSDKKGLITIGGRDPRMTRVGYFIRRFKLDELPQLLNVFVGDMSFVGPRPEVRKYVEMYNEAQLQVLSVRPGITDYASIEYVDENEILGSATDPEKVYIEEIMPHKIRLNMKFIEHKSIKEYFYIIFLTFWHIVK
ncbi:MAG: sugar transferase [Paludibacter sp.]|nr:sugar transferase [Paludibacter sp.]